MLNIPPGAYSVEASYIGHQTVRQTQIEVRLDLTTTVDFALKTEAIEGEAITVVAEAPLVERSLTTSRATIGRAELNNTMPVADLQDLINTTPSVFRGYIRGGRKAEAKVLVDGIDVSDTYFRAGEGLVTWNPYVDVNRTSDGEFTSVGVNASNVQSLDIIAGPSTPSTTRLALASSMLSRAKAATSSRDGCLSAAALEKRPLSCPITL